MKIRLLLVLLSLTLPFSALGEKLLQNVDREGIALQGYDPVAFFTLQQPVRGRKEFTSDHHGARYQFASKKHKELFDADPVKYEPQFGGYCAYGVSRGAVVGIKIEAWQIVNGRLLMQKNEGIRDDFNKDPQGNLKKADAQWPDLVRRKMK